MKLTVVVCTWNRAATLRECLESLAAVRIPSTVEWTVLVVNSGAFPATAEAAGSFATRLPIMHVLEPRPGLSRARNRALDAVRSGYLLWIDDDISVEPGWLEAYEEAFRSWPSAGVFGGPIRPLLLGTPPDWLLRCLDIVEWAYGARDLGTQPAVLGPTIDRFPFGGNLVLCREAIGSRRFPAELGRFAGDRGRGGEEIALIRELLDHGVGGRWVPAAIAHHRIGPERQTRAYLKAYAAGDALDEELNRTTAARAAGMASLVVRWLQAEARYGWSRLAGQPEDWVRRLLHAGDAWGRLLARRSRRRQHRARR